MRLAVNIENPADLSASVESYYATSQSIEFIRSLAHRALEGGSAHALLGPYGAGKSSLAAFALNELSGTTPFSGTTSRTCTSGLNEDPVEELISAGGLAPMPVVGATERLASRIVMALKSFASSDHHLEGSDARSFGIMQDPREATNDQALLMLTEIARSIHQRGKAGTLLVIDEFGRHLEHMLSSANDSDLHLLQDIAEATGQPDCPLSLVIIQHLGLEHYGSMLHGPRRYEWEKVRGRFLETVVNHTETDAAHIIAAAIDSLGRGVPQKRPRSRLPRSWPQVLRDPDFLAAADRCRPLHPMTVVLLSRLARVLGQNDRTITGWLMSAMDTGFQAKQAEHRGSLLYPHTLYDHFLSDALLAPSNPAFVKRFAAIHTAHERMDDDVSQGARVLFRTLALLSFCSGRGVRADKKSALASLPKGFQFDGCIDELTSRSLVLYRQYRGEYMIWEGSDYDITRRIDEQLSLQSFDFAGEMNTRFGPLALAHRHFIRTGNRRMAKISWLNRDDAPPEPEGNPRILVWLTENVPHGASPGDVVAATTAHGLKPHLREAAAIRELLREDSSLQDDTIAAGEMNARLSFHEDRVSSECQEVLESDLGWRVGTRLFPTMQEALSAAMDTTYHRAFHLHCELVNRDRVSGQVTFALRKLIEKLYVCHDKETLGILRFPPERIIYESMLKRTGLHRVSSDGAWRLDLSRDGLSAGLAECVAEVRRKLVKEGSSATSIADIVGHLAHPPYGVKRTPAILLCIFLLLADANAHELYEDGRFLPSWGPDTLLRLLKAPKRFAIVAAEASTIDGRVLHKYGSTLTAKECAPDISPLTLARDVLRRYGHLSHHAKQTSSVSSHAQAFRRAIEVAESPGDMLFRRIPEALGYSKFPARAVELTAFLGSLSDLWIELEGADGALLVQIEHAMLETIGCNTLQEARTHCEKLAHDLSRVRNVRHCYHEFLRYISDSTEEDPDHWLANVADASLGIPMPLKAWSDNDCYQAELVLRRNLLALRRARDLLAERKIADDSAPFVVFCPNPDVMLGEKAQQVVKEMEMLTATMCPDERDALVLNVAEAARR